MPSAPNIDGLPIWLQIIVSVCFGLGTLLVAIKGYRKSPSEGSAIISAQPGGPLQQLQSAAVADMGAIRHLSDVCIQLTGKLQEHCEATREHTHWLRAQHELDREICARLRELREAFERRP